MIRDNISKIRERIVLAAAKVARRPEDVVVVAVAKTRTPYQVTEAIEAGITDIGENRIQEALLKYSDAQLGISDKRIKLHLVGHLQTNKVKDAVKIFDLIHSVDSLRLAQEIDKEAEKINKVQNILIEVKTSPEPAKFGLRPEEVPEIIKQVSRLNHVNIKGLMTIAPLVDNPEEARPYFRMVRELRDRICELRMTNCQLRDLSMGMTDDFEVAVEEGATMVRIGRAIFQEPEVSSG